MSFELVIDAFLTDPAFVKRDELVLGVIPSGGQYRLSGPGLSYFKTPVRLIDERTSRASTFPYNFSTVFSLYLDDNQYSSFLTDFSNFNSAERLALYALIDRINFMVVVADTQATLDTELTSTYGNYVPASLLLSSTRTSCIAYSTGTGADVTLSTPNWVQFDYIFGSGSAARTFRFKIWASDTDFRAQYPISTIQQVVPPLEPSDILYASLTASATNPFTTAAKTAALSQTTLNPTVSSEDSTGFIQQKIKLYDSAGNTLTVTFNILYKGAEPTLSMVRTAIREYLLASGVGPEADWKARAPELFIENQILLIPHWSIVKYTASRTYYPSIAPMTTVRSALYTLVGDSYTTSFIDAHWEVVPAVYDRLILSALPSPENVTLDLSIMIAHPTYQAVSSSSGTFTLMDTTTRDFSVALNQVLAIAAGATSSDDYSIRNEGNMSVIGFTINQIEYLVLTKESFANLVGIPTS